MQGPKSNASASTRRFKQALLKNLLLGLQACTAGAATPPFAAMTLRERKRAVKSSADVAMAAARAGDGGGGARWPKAILAAGAAAVTTLTPTPSSGVARRRRKIVRRCCRNRRGAGAAGGGAGGSRSTSGDVARRLVRKRTTALRKVIPGGDAMDEVSLLREAMDYVVHLRAQVDVLHRISKAVQQQRSSSLLRDSWPQCAQQEKVASNMREL